MSFSDNFIKKPIMTTLLMVSVVIFGIVSYFKLPISDLPVVDFPVIMITVGYPGASPSTMASAVAAPLENQCMQIPGIQSIISDNTEGMTKIILTLQLDRNVDLAAPDVQAAITRATANLPTDLPAPPVYSKINPTEMPIMYLMVNSDTLTQGQLYDYANRTIGQRISMIEGVSQVQVWGAKAAIRIQVSPHKLASYGIGIDEVSRALQKGTVTVPGGSLDGNVRTFSVEPQGQLLTAKDYEQLIVTYRNNAPVKLKDIARCVESIENDVVNCTYGRSGQKMRSGTVVMAVSRAGGSNTVGLAKKIDETLEMLQKEIPGSVKLDVLYDASDSIVDSVNDVKNTIFIALFLVVLVIFLFLGKLSDTIIPAIALPISIIATFGVMLLLRFSLDNLSLMGLTLAVGFVVDDAIVVLENTVRLMEKGKKPMEAALESAREITFTIISMTVSLSVIFIPLIFMGGVVGRIFREFSVTVIIAILCSGVISLTLTPMMCARMLKEGAPNRFQKGVTGYLNGVINKYGEVLKWTLKRPMSTVVIWVICFAGTIVLFKILPQTFIPEGDSGAIFGQMVVPLGTSSSKMQKFQDKVNNIVHEDPNIGKMISLTGMQPGADQSTGIVFLSLKERKERKPIAQVVKQLRAKLAKLTDGFVFIQAMPALKLSAGGESTAQGSKYSYAMTGADQSELYKTALTMEQKMRALPGFVDIQNSVKLTLPRLELKILRDRASSLGVTAADIESALSLAYAGGRVATYKTDVDQYDVIVELDREYQKKPESLSMIYLRSPVTGSLVPLASVVQIKRTVGPQDVPHFDQLNSATLSFNLQPGVPLGDATKALEKLASGVLPPGVSGDLQGEAAQFKDAVSSLGILIIIAIFLKYIILGILYESYVHPLTILTTLPVATFGGLLTLLLFGSELSLYAYVGVFMLLGIVAKNGIMMVDFAQANLKKGNISDFDAIYEASIVRFRPILMTGLAAIMGAIPIALGFGADGESRMPLGLIVVGGLIFSQVITLFVTPGLFLYMQKFQVKYLDRFELTRSEAAREAMEKPKKSISSLPKS